MKTRKPNAGPYIVSYRTYSGALVERECQTWSYACAVMRAFLMEGYAEVSVRFA